MSYNVYSKFDIKQHKETYVNYLEVVILEDGTVEYAVPSHQEKLISLVMEHNNWTRDQVAENTPKEYYFDWITWLLRESHSVLVWTDFVKFDKINKAQYNKLKSLKLNGIYKGSLPTV